VTVRSLGDRFGPTVNLRKGDGIMNKLPSDLLEAANLLRKFEQTRNNVERVRCFEDAVDLLDGYIADDPNSQNGTYAANAKLTYTKRLLMELPSLVGLDMDEWFSYMVLLISPLGKEVDLLTRENEELGKQERDFLSIWSDEIIALIGSRLKTYRPVGG
jgi:hypothetical protein